MDDSFYDSLKVVDNFAKVSDSNFYRSAPRDWWVLITDIRGSTKAIEAGRYKDVNQLGVATIIFVKNLLQTDKFLYVFGGDGATLVLSDDQYQKIVSELDKLEHLANNRFKLDLRVGAVRVEEVIEEGIELDVALLKINPNQNMAVFLGGGLSRAEDIVKSREYSEKPVTNKNDPSLDGLSCRWQPLPAKNGQIVSLLIASQVSSKAAHVYAEVISKLNDIFGGDIDNANPVNIHQGSYKGLARLLSDEAKLHFHLLSASYVKRCLEILICVLCFKLGLPLFQKENYVSAIPGHSDFKKVDDILRMVLDGSASQIIALESVLDDLHQQKKIYYGIYKSSSALMTCMVEGLADGEHFHFIDGSDGGYAMAAKQMKAQISSIS